jgi:two-component system OmpR family response regulator
MPVSQSEEATHILLVEDDQNLSFLYASALRSAGYYVKQAATEAEAIELLKEPSPKLLSLVITDWCLPDGTAASVCTQARVHNPDVLVMLISGQADLHTVQISDCHVNGWLSKPSSAQALLSMVRQLLENAEHQVTHR